MSELEQTQLERPYTFFLFKRLDQIYDAWDEGDYRNALRRALRLVVGLPTDIKEKLWSKKEMIEKELDDAYQAEGVDWFTGQNRKSKVSFQVSYYYLEPFVDEMVRLLDDKQWLERGAVSPRFKKERKLTV